MLCRQMKLVFINNEIESEIINHEAKTIHSKLSLFQWRYISAMDSILLEYKIKKISIWSYCRSSS